MEKRQQRTAILIFARSAKAESKVKQFAAVNRRKNRKLAEELLNHSLQIAKATGLAVFYLSETEQKGNTFGRRLTHAFRKIFTKGFHQVIAIGSDCPALSTVRLQQAARFLQSHPAVLGPAHDGGVYLIGLQAQAFDESSLKNIHWQNERVFQTLQQLLAPDGLHVLVKEADVDHAGQLNKILSLGKLFHRLFYRLKRIIGAAGMPQSPHVLVFVKNTLLRTFTHRGPPSYITPITDPNI